MQTLKPTYNTEATVSVVTFGTHEMFLWMMATAGMAICLITNLAALTTRITIPVFFLSIFVDLLVIGYSLNHILSA